MDNENETQPLLPAVAGESWRIRTRKRCMRIPSEITITGIILGLFLVVVTLLIVLQDMEAEKKDDISVDKKLLASPFKYNKAEGGKSWQDEKAMKLANKDKKFDKINKGWKVSPEILGSAFKYDKNVDPSWQAKKEMQMKNKERKLDNINKGFKKMPNIPNMLDPSWQAKKEMQMKNKERKLDNINKGFKKMPNIPNMLGKTIKRDREESIEDKEDIKRLGNPEITHDYGKEVDYSLEDILEPQMSYPSALQKFNEDVSEIKKLLHSSTKWKKVDEGWKTLSEQGWKDREIRRALAKAINMKRRELMESEDVQSAPISFDQIWDNIIEGWKKNIDKGKDDEDSTKGTIDEDTSDEDNEARKGNKEAKRQISINDDWKNKMNILQSPKSAIKDFIKNDPGWQKLSEQGWKKKDIEEAVVEALKEKEKEKETETDNLQLQQSPMNVPSLFGKATDFFKSLLPKGSDQQKSQMAINDKWAEKFNSLQSPMFSSKKSKKGKKKQSKDDWNAKTTDTIPTASVPQNVPISLEIIIELIIASIRDQQMGNKEIESQTEVINQLNTEVSYTSKQTNENEIHTKFGGKDDGVATASPQDQIHMLRNSMPFDQAKRNKVNNGWETIMDPGLKDKILGDAVNKAWKNSNKLVDSAVGLNDMKWKKVNNGWKKVSNNS